MKKLFELPELLTLDGRSVTGDGNEEAFWGDPGECPTGCGNGCSAGCSGGGPGNSDCGKKAT